MELTQGMELAQVLKLSPGLLQSMEILQMNTQELTEFLPPGNDYARTGAE